MLHKTVYSIYATFNIRFSFQSDQKSKVKMCGAHVFYASKDLTEST